MKKSMAIIILLALTAGMGFAQKGQRMMSKEGMRGSEERKERMAHFGWMRDAMLEEIGVAEAVRVQIREMMAEMRKEAMDTQFQIGEKHREMRKELTAKELNEAKIKTLIQEMAELRKTQAIQMETRKLELIKLLTPEQREKLFTALEKGRKDFFERRREEGSKGQRHMMKGDGK